MNKAVIPKRGSMSKGTLMRPMVLSNMLAARNGV